MKKLWVFWIAYYRIGPPRTDTSVMAYADGIIDKMKFSTPPTRHCGAAGFSVSSIIPQILLKSHRTYLYFWDLLCCLSPRSHRASYNIGLCQGCVYPHRIVQVFCASPWRQPHSCQLASVWVADACLGPCTRTNVYPEGTPFWSHDQVPILASM